MKYEVTDKKFYKIDDIVKIEDFKYEFRHLETTFDLEKYVLDVDVFFLNSLDESNKKMLSLPVELATTMTEQLTADVKFLEISVQKNGIELEFTLDIDVLDINDNEEIKEEIKDNYQHELEEKMQTREDELNSAEMNDNVKEDEEKVDIVEKNNIIKIDEEEGKFDLLSMLKTKYEMYKIISLDEGSLDKISAKYNLSIDYLYEMKKSNNKVIVHVEK